VELALQAATPETRFQKSTFSPPVMTPIDTRPSPRVTQVYDTSPRAKFRCRIRAVSEEIANTHDYSQLLFSRYSESYRVHNRSFQYLGDG